MAPREKLRTPLTRKAPDATDPPAPRDWTVQATNCNRLRLGSRGPQVLGEGEVHFPRSRTQCDGVLHLRTVRAARYTLPSNGPRHPLHLCRRAAPSSGIPLGTHTHVHAPPLSHTRGTRAGCWRTDSDVRLEAAGGGGRGFCDREGVSRRRLLAACAGARAGRGRG